MNHKPHDHAVRNLQPEHAQVQLFADLTENEIDVLLSASESQDLPAGKVIYHQGEFSSRLYLVRSGLVRISQVTQDGEDVLIRFAGPGHIFGYGALALSQFQSPSSAQIVRPSSLAVWECETLRNLLFAMPQVAFNLFTIATQHAAYFYNRALRLQSESVGERIKWALAELSRTIGAAGAGGHVIVEGSVQRELAELAGTTIFTVSRELGKLERRGILSKERGRILIRNPQEPSR